MVAAGTHTLCSHEKIVSGRTNETSPTAEEGKADTSTVFSSWDGNQLFQRSQDREENSAATYQQ